MSDYESSVGKENKFTKNLKIIIVGDMSTGKTSIIKKYLNNEFDETVQATIVPEFSKKIEKSNDVIFKIQFWDLPGQDRNPAITSVFCRDTHGIIYCCDINLLKSVENIKQWDESIKYYNDIEKTPKILLANKSDLLKDEKQKNDINNILKNISSELSCINYFITSAKTGKNINKSIDYFINEVIKVVEEQDIMNYNSITLDSLRGDTCVKCC